MLINGRYKYDLAKDLLGKGGFSDIYRATDTLLDREVALKFFRADTDTKYGILDEIKRVVHFRHPNLVQYYDLVTYQMQDFHGSAQTIYVGVLEYINSKDLYNFMRSRPTDDALRQVMIEILEGLQYIHNHRVIHRDLKPQNILMHYANGRWTPKISDFGISKSLDSHSAASSELLGTVEYMAPEQFNSARYGINGKISTNVDLWSFGVILYELFSGQPFFGKRSREVSTMQIMNNVLKDQDRTKLQKIKEPFRSAIHLCLIQDANTRVKQPSDLIRILKGERAGVQRATRDTTPPTQAQRPVAASPERPSSSRPAPVSSNRPSSPIANEAVVKKENLAWQKVDSGKSKKPPIASEKKEVKKKNKLSPAVWIIPLVILVAGTGAYFGMNYYADYSAQVSKLQEEEKTAFLNVKSDPSIEKLKQFLKTYPSGSYLSEAEKLFFTLLRKLNDTTVCNDYLSLFPEGYHLSDVRIIKKMKSNALNYSGADSLLPGEFNALKDSVPIPENTPVESGQPDFVIVAESEAQTDNNPNGFKYEGDMDGDLPHGQGTMKYGNGDIYEGTFQMGKRHGQGKMIYAKSKNTFEGIWEEDREKKGIYRYSSGKEWYDGGWQDGKMTGIGTYHFATGSEYTGQVVDGIPQGTGEMQSSNGDYYRGQWFEGKMHGTGLYIYKSRDKYEGNFSKGLKHGSGKYFWENGDSYNGSFREGEKDGYGIFKSHDGTQYKGYWRNDKWNGNGVLIYENGDSIVATWTNGVQD